MRVKYKQWAVDYLDEHPEVALEKVDVSDVFFLIPDMRLEIGSGKGEFIIQMAKKYPNVHFLAVEVVRTVAGILTKRIVDENIDNVKVFAHDVETLFEMIPDGFFNKIYLNFSDPWPKKRHEKRRLTHHRFLEQYHHILSKKGEVIFKTDNVDLYHFSLEEVEQSEFKIVSMTEDYVFDSENDAMSEYEAKFRGLGNKICRMVLKGK